MAIRGVGEAMWELDIRLQDSSLDFGPTDAACYTLPSRLEWGPAAGVSIPKPHSEMLGSNPREMLPAVCSGGEGLRLLIFRTLSWFIQ